MSKTNEVSLKYISFGTPISHKTALIKALETRFSAVENHSEPQSLLTVRGAKAGEEQAEIIVRAQGAKYNLAGDLGLRRNKRGQYVFLVPSFNVNGYGQIWVQSLVAQCLYLMVAGDDPTEQNEGLELIKSSSGLYLAAVNLLCDNWCENRTARLEEIIVAQRWAGGATEQAQIYTALKTGQFSKIQLSQPATKYKLNFFVEATQDSDPEIAQAAYQYLCQLPESWLNLVAQIWLDDSQEVLLNVLKARQFIPSQPPLNRIIVALKLGLLDELTQGSVDVVQPLVKATQRGDPEIAKHAWEALRSLQTQAAKEQFCQLVVDEENLKLAELAQEMGYYPLDLSRRALFFFLSERWDDYDGIDFDRRLLRVIYRTAKPALQRRLTTKVQRAGRVEYLSILGATAQVGSQSYYISADEAQLLVELLAEKGEWEQLWGQVTRLPVQWSAYAVQKLSQADWQPRLGEDRAAFEQLKGLAAQQLVTSREALTSSLNQAVMRARVRVAGRVNDLAFAHRGARLALSVGDRKVILWNLETAQQDAVLSGFRYPIGNVKFMPDDTLIWAERPQNNAAFPKLYSWEGSSNPHQTHPTTPKYNELGQVGGAITALQPFSDELALTASRDGRALVWNIPQRTMCYELHQKIESWTAAVCLSPDKQQLALLHQRIELYDITSRAGHELSWVGASERDVINSLKHGAFSPDGRQLAAGRFNGELALWQLANLNKPFGYETNVFNEGRRIDTSIEGLATLDNGGVLLLATSDGHIQYLDWTTQKVLGQLDAPGEKLTTLRVSPDGAFMAVGDRNRYFTMWDLRLLAVYRLLFEPLALARPVHLGALAALPDYGLDLSEPLQNTLKFIEAVVRHRYRFDVEVTEFSLIQSGEYDIEVED